MNIKSNNEDTKIRGAGVMQKSQIKNMASCWKIPRPRKELKELLDALGITMTLGLPHRDINVDTRKKLPARRKRNIVK